jgi:hypothetical protein
MIGVCALHPKPNGPELEASCVLSERPWAARGPRAPQCCHCQVQVDMHAGRPWPHQTRRSRWQPESSSLRPSALKSRSRFFLRRCHCQGPLPGAMCTAGTTALVWPVRSPLRLCPQLLPSERHDLHSRMHRPTQRPKTVKTQGTNSSEGGLTRYFLPPRHNPGRDNPTASGQQVALCHGYACWGSHETRETHSF